ncbi:MAG: glycosyltransferase [Crocinitomicaceae bacterium]|nr:glycosyltransferase [Crocinitomicaceae bacterium]
MPSVTIVIPCRNEEKYIRQNIQSILDQDYSGFCEVFVVDGMSTDDTRGIVLELENKYPEKVRLIDNPKKFTPDALNIGIESSSAEIFIILGGHAFLDKSFVSKNVEHLISDPSLGCTGGL